VSGITVGLRPLKVIVQSGTSDADVDALRVVLLLRIAFMGLVRRAVLILERVRYSSKRSIKASP
jgi:hypothetical protein